ncbi:MAG: 1,4-alpha-glucan branching protein GlgB [Defluviitaleaceae bacterium]|nr:1,4-alpha-glucan branching protein GlgB [Defluviitaleaceae bacterium]
MLTTNMHELTQIINCEHPDPHHILGIHELHVDGQTQSIIRVFAPSASKVEVIFDEDKHTLPQRFVMEKIHNAGFYTLQLQAPPSNLSRYRLAFTSTCGKVWEGYDPYSFMPILSELDLYLLGQGTHYQIYDKLGANTITVDGITGVHFAVWAPNAKRISVIGEFNGWDGQRHPMRNLGASGVWELFVPGLCDYDSYKYEIKSHTGDLFAKADPYARFAEHRPNTASMVYNINNYQWKDEKWLKNRNKKDPLLGPINIYELHPGSWRRVAEEGDRFMSWPEMTREIIPYVIEMGYTHIELMPIMEHPFDGSWGYQVTGYYAPTSRYGNPHEFMAFVDACHQNNIGVILDWVPAHFPKDAHGLAMFDGTSLYEHDDPKMGEHPEWGTLIFNYSRNEVKNFLIANALFWAEKYHIDGLRVDAVASMLYLDYGKDSGQWVPNQHGGRENISAMEFMKHMNSILAQKHPNVLIIAEESTAWPGVTRPVQDDGLGYSLKWNMGWMNDFLYYMKLDSVHRKFHHNCLTFGMVYAYSEKYMLVLSHDEVVHGKGSMANKMPGDTWQKLANLRAAYGFMMGHPGKKLLFMGGEFGQFEEWSEARSLNWFLLDHYEHHRQVHRFVKDLNHMYLKERALWQRDFSNDGFGWINCDDNERSIISFFRVAEVRRRSKADQEAKGSTYEHLIFVCNFTPVPCMDYRVGVPVPGRYTEILNSDHEKYGGSGIINTGALRSEEYLCDGRQYSVHIKLPALSVVVLKNNT